MITIKEYEEKLLEAGNKEVYCEKCLGEYIPAGDGKYMVCHCED